VTSDGEVYSTSIFIDDRCTYTYQDNAGKLRMRKWVELFDEPRLSELPRALSVYQVAGLVPAK